MLSTDFMNQMMFIYVPLAIYTQYSLRDYHNHLLRKMKFLTIT